MALNSNQFNQSINQSINQLYFSTCINGKFECIGTSCKETCTDQFACKNGDCIDPKYRCDKHSDCMDGSDEVNCSKLFYIMLKTLFSRERVVYVPALLLCIFQTVIIKLCVHLLMFNVNKY